MSTPILAIPYGGYSPEPGDTPHYREPTLEELERWALRPLGHQWSRRWKARSMGRFWLPCPACGRRFGGHEWLSQNTIHVAPGRGQGFCPGHVRPDDWPMDGFVRHYPGGDTSYITVPREDDAA